MQSPIPLALALLAAPALSLAQATPPPTAAVADPGAAVPVPEYRSALAQGPRGVAHDSLDWKAANAEVGRFPRGHADILKWEQSQGQAPHTPSTPAAAPPSKAPGPMHHHHQEPRR